MAWERRSNGLYYYRSHREGRRVRKEYIGSGPTAILIAEMDRTIRADRATWKADQRERRRSIEAADESLAVIDQATDIALSNALIAAGFHRHNRGEWRKRRANETCSQ
jgi:hypothetical protein